MCQADNFQKLKRGHLVTSWLLHIQVFSAEQVWVAGFTKAEPGFDWLLTKSTEVINAKWPLALLLATEHQDIEN